MKCYDYVLLDWDGNLAKTLDLWHATFKQVLSEEGYYPDDKEISAAFGKVSDYFASLGISNPKEVYERADQIGKKKLPEIELYPDALEVLEYLKTAGKHTALITASRQANLAPVFERYAISQLFDVIITRDDITKNKPDPESLLLALSKLGGTPDQAIMIGDSDKDLGAAQNAGIDSLLFFPPEHERFYNLEWLKQHKPTYIIDDFRKVMTIIK